MFKVLNVIFFKLYTFFEHMYISETIYESIVQTSYEKLLEKMLTMLVIAENSG